MAVSYTEAERMVEDMLYKNDEMLAISIMDMRGNMLAAKTKESFKQAFTFSRNGEYGGFLAVEMLSLVNRLRNVVGSAKAILTLHEGCELMLVPLPHCQILVGLVLRHSVDAQDYNIANLIERLVAKALDQNAYN
jgi:hypothetical protein